MKLKTLLLFILKMMFGVMALIAQPTNNPIAEFYTGENGYPAWTDEIKWNNVITMVDKGTGAANLAEFNAKRDILYAQGGGVLYYPAGTYVFDISDAPNSEGLMLKKGVVIRGQKPSSDASAVLPNPDIQTMGVTDHGLKNLPTKFQFTTTNLSGALAGNIAKTWNCIGIKKGSGETGLEKIEKVGVCWIEIEYGFIYFGFDTETGWPANCATPGYNFGKSVEPWKSTRTPDGTHPMDWFTGNKDWGTNRIRMGTKRFVFGVHLKQGGVPNYVCAHGLASYFYCEDGPWSFGSKISVYGSNVLVANNVVSKPTKCFKMNITAGATKAGQCALAIGTTVEVPYDFGKGLSIDVNKCYVAGFANNSAVDDPSSQYTHNVLVLDNWIYNHSSKGYELAGGWMVVKNNINRRERYTNTDVYTLGLSSFYGVHASSGRIWPCKWNDDFMARAFSVSSKNTWFHKNQFNNLGSDYDNSGEGILHQDHINGSECYSSALTYNIGTSYMGVWQSYATGYFLGWNKASSGIMVANPTGYCADLSSVKHTDFSGNDYAFDGSLSSNTNVKDFKTWDCSGANPTPGTPTITAKDTADYVKITWNNVANEAAYRVEKKLTSSSTWTVIAYRPRQETGCVISFNGVAPSIYTSDGHGTDAWDTKVRDMNPKVWRDYLKSNGQYQYRVVAVGCNDLTSTATSTPVTVNISVDNNETVTIDKTAKLELYPIPANDILYGSIAGEEVKNVKVYSMLGKVVQSNNSIKDYEFSISLNGLTTGYYIIEVNTLTSSFKKLIYKN